MPENKWLRIAADALLDEKLTDAAAASGEAIGYYMQRPNLKEAADQFSDALRRRETVRDDDPVAASMAANTAAGLLPQTRLIKAINRAKDILNGSISTIDTSKRNVRIGNKRFPSEGSMEEFQGKKIPMKDGHYGILKGNDYGGTIWLHDKKGKAYQEIRFDRDNDDTVVIHYDFPTDHGKDNPDLRRGRSREMRHIMAEHFGGIGSDPGGDNSQEGMNAYYRDPKARRVYPEDLEDTQNKATFQSRFFTPGDDVQAEAFDEAFAKKFKGHDSQEHKDPDRRWFMSEEQRRKFIEEQSRERKREEAESAKRWARIEKARRAESQAAIEEITRRAPDVYSRKQRQLSELPPDSPDRRHVIVDRRRELLTELPERDRLRIHERGYAGELMDEDKTPWSRFLEILKNP